MLYLYILIGILAAATLITLITATIIELIKSKISKEVITQDNLKVYEESLKSYLMEKDITMDELLEICKGEKSKVGTYPLKISIEEISLFDKRLKCGEAVIDNDGSGGYIVYVADNLSTKSMRFAVAHEIGHLVMKDKLPVCRKWHGIFIRSKDEQIRDYIAAAILLPFDEFSSLLKQVNYDALDKKGKIKFIESLSDERDVDKEVIIKRIMECKTIVGEKI